MSQKFSSVILFAICFVLTCGCEHSTTSKTDNISIAVHDHEQEKNQTRRLGPNGGTMVEWGGGVFLVEVIIDHANKEATVYIFGNDGKTPMPIGSKSIVLAIREPSFAMELTPRALSSEILGNASRFVGTHENLEQGRNFTGAISGVIGDTPYSGDFAEQ